MSARRRIVLASRLHMALPAQVRPRDGWSPACDLRTCAPDAPPRLHAMIPWQRVRHAQPLHRALTCRDATRMRACATVRPPRRSHAAVVRHRRRLGLLCAQRIAVAPHAPQLRKQQQCMRRWWPDGFATRRVSKSTGHAEPPRRGATACACPVARCAVAVCRRGTACASHLSRVARVSHAAHVYPAQVRAAAGTIVRPPGWKPALRGGGSSSLRGSTWHSPRRSGPAMDGHLRVTSAPAHRTPHLASMR